MKRASVGRAELLLLSGSVGVVLLGVVGAEMGLRWIDPRRLDRREVGHQVYSEWYGWDNRPGFEGLNHDVLTTVDSRGRRSPGTVTRDSAPRPRVLMLGDSITYGTGVRDEETFCALMAQRYDVVNLRVGGLENPRILLASNRQWPRGLGNAHDLVGRFFMEHPRFVGGFLMPSDPRLPVGFYDHHDVGRSRVVGYLSIARKVRFA